MYKTSDGKPENFLSSEFPTSKAEAVAIIEECHERWSKLKNGQTINKDGLYIGV